jgi:hypothetical protein
MHKLAPVAAKSAENVVDRDFSLWTCRVSCYRSSIGNHGELRMTIKTALLAMTLVLSPALASASCWMESQTSASACGEGLVWDAGSQTCIAPISS